MSETNRNYKVETRCGTFYIEQTGVRHKCWRHYKDGRRSLLVTLILPNDWMKVDAEIIETLVCDTDLDMCAIPEMETDMVSAD